MEFRIAPELAARFPGVEIHAVRARSFLAGAQKLDHEEQLRAAVSRVKTLGIERDKLSAYPPLARWREAYAALKVRPSAYRASIESLLRRALGGADLSLPIASVNLYNAVSLHTLAPMGAYDTAKLPSEPMLLRFADPAKDRFTPLGGKAADFPLNPDLVVYASGNTVLCWGFNHRDNVETALDAHSDDIVFFSEALNAEDGVRSAQAVETVRSRLTAIGVVCSDPLRADRAEPSFEF